MELGMIGLGRMGANMVLRLLRGGHECVVFDLSPENVAKIADQGATPATTLEDFAQALRPPRARGSCGSSTSLLTFGCRTHFGLASPVERF